MSTFENDNDDALRVTPLPAVGRVIRVLELRAADGPGGGPEKTILAGAALSDPRRFEITVAYCRHVSDSCQEIEDRARRLGVRYCEIRTRGPFDKSAVRRLQDIVCERQIDVIHSHDYKTDALTWIMARRNRCGFLATAHGWTGRSLRERAVYYPLDRRILRRFPRVISVSSEITQTLVRSGVAQNRITTLANGVDAVQFAPEPQRRAPARKALGVDERDFVIGAVGRLEQQKRFDLLIDAFATIQRQYPDSVLLVAGDGRLQRKLQQQIDRRNLAGRCRLIGHVSTIKDFYQALDLFVQSSDYEGTPNVVLEAMAMEAPVIATSAGGTCDVLRAGVDGLIVAPGDRALIADAIDRVRRDPTATLARVAAARRRVAAELSFAARNAKLESIYRDLLSSGPPCR